MITQALRGYEILQNCQHEEVSKSVLKFSVENLKHHFSNSLGVSFLLWEWAWTRCCWPQPPAPILWVFTQRVRSLHTYSEQSRTQEDWNETLKSSCPTTHFHLYSQAIGVLFWFVKELMYSPSQQFIYSLMTFRLRKLSKTPQRNAPACAGVMQNAPLTTCAGLRSCQLRRIHVRLCAQLCVYTPCACVSMFCVYRPGLC